MQYLPLDRRDATVRRQKAQRRRQAAAGALAADGHPCAVPTAFCTAGRSPVGEFKGLLHGSGIAELRSQNIIDIKMYTPCKR